MSTRKSCGTGSSTHRGSIISCSGAGAGVSACGGAGVAGSSFVRTMGFSASAMVVVVVVSQGVRVLTLSCGCVELSRDNITAPGVASRFGN